MDSGVTLFGGKGGVVTLQHIHIYIDTSIFIR